jgi:hypothetical protein
MRYLICILLLGGAVLQARASVLSSWPAQYSGVTDSIAPKVFMIGEYERQFEALMQEHSMLLLTACNNDMNFAFEKWQGMLGAMETHSEKVNFDLKGVKLWLNVFWEEDGGIKHIAFHLKPNSRNVDTDKLSLFLISFINNYRFPLVVGEKFSHYGMATFPTFYKKPPAQNQSGGAAPLVKDSTPSPNNNHEK